MLLQKVVVEAPLDILCYHLMCRIKLMILNGSKIPFNIIGVDTAYISDKSIQSALESDYGYKVKFFYNGMSVVGVIND